MIAVHEERRLQQPLLRESFSEMRRESKERLTLFCRWFASDLDLTFELK